MVLEATMICIDTSEFMRNGDYTPTRLGAQQDAVNLLARAKTQSNAESSVGVVACAGRNVTVLVSLTNDMGKILSSTHGIRVSGRLDFSGGIQVAQLALKHRQNKNQHQRIVFFVGSPLKEDKDSLVRLAKRLRKSNIAVDVVNFGEEAENTEKLEAFVSAVNNDNNSHLVTVPPGPHILSDILTSSPIIAGESGAPVPGLSDEFGGIDPNIDPDLALAIKYSMEEEKARQESLKKQQGGTESPAATGEKNPEEKTREVDMSEMAEDEEALLAQALELSVQEQPRPAPVTPLATPKPVESTRPAEPVPTPMDLSEEDELAMALSLSRQDEEKTTTSDISKVIGDPNFVNSVLQTLPGVDPNDERIKNVLASLSKKEDEKKDKK